MQNVAKWSQIQSTVLTLPEFPFEVGRTKSNSKGVFQKMLYPTRRKTRFFKQSSKFVIS